MNDEVNESSLMEGGSSQELAALAQYEEAQKVRDYLNDMTQQVTDLTRLLLLVVRKYVGDDEKVLLEKVAAATLGEGDALNLDVTASHYVVWTSNTRQRQEDEALEAQEWNELWDADPED